MRVYRDVKPFTFKYMALLTLFYLCLGTSRADANPVASPANAGELTKLFPISYWVGPLQKFQTIERYREIKEAGMTFIMPAGAGATNKAGNLKILELSGEVGLKAFILDKRMPTSITGNPEATAALDAIIDDYKDQPALAGYFLKDEPPASKFKGLSEVVAYLHAKDPGHLVFINVFPNYATANQLGASSYDEYIRTYLKVVQPFVLSYDHYHFRTQGDGTSFFQNLATARGSALNSGVPFWQIVLAAQIDGYRNLTESELRFEAMQTLAYGGKGLLWFTYWQVSTWSHSLILADGSRDPHYEMIQGINREVQALGGQLLDASSIAVFHSGLIPLGGTGRPVGTPVEITGAGDLTVGVFKDQSKLLALVTNDDYRHATGTEVLLYGLGVPCLYDVAKNQWQRVDAERVPGGSKLKLDLPPSGAVLLSW